MWLIIDTEKLLYLVIRSRQCSWVSGFDYETSWVEDVNVASLFQRDKDLEVHPETFIAVSENPNRFQKLKAKAERIVTILE